MKFCWFVAVVLLVSDVGVLRGQRLLEEWHARSSAGADALVTGAAAVFLNPAQVMLYPAAGVRGEAVLLDLRAPGATGVNGAGLAGAARLNARTTLAAGYEHVGVEGITQTTTSPEIGTPLVVGEDRFAAAAAHTLRGGMTIGALVQYTRLPDFMSTRSVIALGLGLRHQPLARLPLTLAGMAATEGEETYWMAGVDYSSGQRWREWVVRGEYGIAQGPLSLGLVHRVVATGQWRGLADVSAGVAAEPDGAGHSVQPVLGTSLRYTRYRLGVVREQLPNDFGGAWSFRFAVSF